MGLFWTHQLATGRVSGFPRVQQKSGVQKEVQMGAGVSLGPAGGAPATGRGPGWATDPLKICSEQGLRGMSDRLDWYQD